MYSTEGVFSSIFLTTVTKLIHAVIIALATDSSNLFKIWWILKLLHYYTITLLHCVTNSCIHYACMCMSSAKNCSAFMNSVIWIGVC